MAGGPLLRHHLDDIRTHGDSSDGQVGDGNHELLLTASLHFQEHALDTIEGTTVDTDMVALGQTDLIGPEVEDVSLCLLGHTDEVLHIAVGYHHLLTPLLTDDRACEPVTGLAKTRLSLLNFFLSATDEHQLCDGGHQTPHLPSLLCLHTVTQGDITVQPRTAQGIAHRHLFLKYSS